MHTLGARWAISLCTLGTVWCVASCSGSDSSDNPGAGDAGESSGGAAAHSGAGGKSHAEAGAAAGGDLGMGAEGGTDSGSGGGPIGQAGTDSGGAHGDGGSSPGTTGGVAGSHSGGAENHNGGALGLGGTGGDAGSNTGGAGADAGSHAGGAGGDAGSDTGGAGGAGGTGGIEANVVFDFEDGVQGFTTDGANVTIATSTTRAVTGSHSLKVTLPSMTSEERKVFVDGQAFWPGTVVELNVWVPEGNDDLYVQAFSFIDFYQWDATNSLATPLVRGGWTKWTYTVPKTFPGGMQRMGIQFGAGPTTFAGGDVYVDAIATVDGAAACSGEAVTNPIGTPGRTAFDFESASPEWEVDGGATDVALSLSGDHVMAGTSALKVALTAVPAGERRKVRINGPETFCGDTVTFNVWTPASSDGLNVQAYMQYNNWAGWASVAPTSINRGAYTEITLTIPGLSSTPAVGPGGYQQLGIEIENATGAAFTGDVYLDEVRW